MAHDQEVGGIRCLEVLKLLQPYVDGEVAPAEMSRINAHLEGCDWCNQFGERYGALVQKIRETHRNEHRAVSEGDPAILNALKHIRNEGKVR